MKAPPAAGRAALLVEAGEDRLALGRQRRQVDQHGDHAALDLVLVVVHCPGPRPPCATPGWKTTSPRASARARAASSIAPGPICIQHGPR